MYIPEPPNNEDLTDEEIMGLISLVQEGAFDMPVTEETASQGRCPTPQEIRRNKSQAEIDAILDPHCTQEGINKLLSAMSADPPDNVIGESHARNVCPFCERDDMLYNEPCCPYYWKLIENKLTTFDLRTKEKMPVISFVIKHCPMCGRKLNYNYEETILERARHPRRYD